MLKGGLHFVNHSRHRPGSRITGFGLVQLDRKSGRIQPLAFGVIQLDEKAALAQRLKELGESLQKILEKYKPNVVSIEKIFLGKNADSAFKLGHARGVAMYESACFGIPVFEYATRVVKKGITGKGGASKEDVQMVLQRLLGIRAIKRIDASDALALAVYHAHQMLTERTVARVFGARKREMEL
jgi:crossover junction endodeoxyribonuclease RuvC